MNTDSTNSRNMDHSSARVALMLGNFIIGLAIVGIAGMLSELAKGLDVTIQQAGLLVTAGAIVLCVGSPLTVWATSAFDRRLLLTSSLFIVALGHFASAFAPNYGVLLALRVLMLIAAALFTPVAASTVAMIVPQAERHGAITFVFLGWSLSVAVGLPAVAFLAAHAGWQATFAAMGVGLLACAVLVFQGLPPGLSGTPISFSSWGALGRNRFVVTLLALTAVQIAGQFVVFTYLVPLLRRLAGADVMAIGIFFSTFGVMGFIGNVIATRLVTKLGPFTTSGLALLSIFLGFTLWSLGVSILIVMGAGVALWGLGFAAINSMQQARLIGAVPALGSAAVALNTSAVYVGQAIGSALGGVLFAHDLPRAQGYAAMILVGLSLVLLATTRDSRL
ncbi:purine efflux pump PbuE [mine drainage metagenome]|uniref:Purine efflux pump PbuE n=1 Tax=mine drainage metagenome TaxID=410659 RepID=A0A1J5SPA9_9ZZZZ